MKEFLNSGMTVWIDNVGPVKGVLVGVTSDLLLLRGEKDKVYRVPKGHVSLFVPDEEPDASEDEGVFVLFCENGELGCPGVQFVVAGKGFKRSDFELFMKGCPKRCDTCRHGSRGEIGNVDRKLLSAMMDKTLYGRYPEDEG